MYHIAIGPHEYVMSLTSVRPFISATLTIVAAHPLPKISYIYSQRVEFTNNTPPPIMKLKPHFVLVLIWSRRIIYAGKAAVTKSIKAFQTTLIISFDVISSEEVRKKRSLPDWNLPPMPKTATGKHFPGSSGFQDFSTGSQKAIRITMMKIFRMTMAAVTEKRNQRCILVAMGPKSPNMNRTIEVLLHVDETMERQGAINVYLTACSRLYWSLSVARCNPNPYSVATVTSDMHPIPES